MADFHLTQTVADAFNALADEVQVLTDRKTILEHKLRFAHEQVSLKKRALLFFSFLFFRHHCIPLHTHSLFGTANMMRYH